jgi:hypothetical protein
MPAASSHHHAAACNAKPNADAHAHARPAPPQVTIAGATAGLGSRDPKVAALHQEMAEIDRKLAANALDIPPGERGLQHGSHGLHWLHLRLF